MMDRQSTVSACWGGFVATVTILAFTLFGVPVIQALAHGVHP